MGKNSRSSQYGSQSNASYLSKRQESPILSRKHRLKIRFQPSTFESGSEKSGVFEEEKTVPRLGDMGKSTPSFMVENQAVTKEVDTGSQKQTRMVTGGENGLLRFNLG